MILEKYFRSRNQRIYIEKTFKGTESEYIKCLGDSKTIYVSGIKKNCREERLWLLFSTMGEIKRLIMGINRAKLTFCGFFFVEYNTKEEAENAMVFFDSFILDGDKLKVDKDVGFSEGRQYGRGVFGGIYKNDRQRKFIRTGH